MTHPTQACHDQYEWVPGCVAREEPEPEPEREAELSIWDDEAASDAGEEEKEEEPLEVD